MNSSYKKLPYLGILLLFTSVYSQEDTAKYQTEEIMVTGTRVEQKVIDIPFSVQRISQSSWSMNRKIGVNDVLTTVPGLFLQSRYGNHDVRVSIRGFGSRSNSGIRGVRMLLDGIPESEPDGQTRIEAIDMTSIGKIEVVKGNSSSLYTNAPGGVINFLTDKYFPTTLILNENEFGSYDLIKSGIKAGVNLPGSQFMITTSYENYKGYRNHSQQYQTRLNAVYAANITSKSLLTVNGYYVDGLIKLPGALQLYQYNENDTAANSRSLSRDEKRITQKGRVGLNYNTSFGKDKINNMIEITGYGTVKNLERTAATYRIITRYGIGSSYRYVNKFTFGKGKLKRTNEFSVGGDLYYQTGPISEFDNISGKKGDQLENLNDETITNVGFYFVEQFPLIPDRLSLLITGRYDRVTYSSQNLQGSYQDTSRLFDGFAPKFGLNLKLTPLMSVYGSFGLGFDSPAFNELDNYPYSSDQGLHLINPDLRAQRSINFELGYKGNLPPAGKNFFNNTFVEITAFNSKIDSAIIPFTVDGTVYYRNAATSKRTGVELGFNTEIVKGLTLRGAYTFSDFKYDEYTAQENQGDTLITEKDYSGNIEPSNPDHLLSADLEYKYTLRDKYTFFVRTNLQYVGEMFVNDANTDSLKTKAYTLLNAQGGVDLKFGNLKLLAYVGFNNLTDEKYVAFIQINSDRREYYESGPRRNFFSGLTLAYMFR